MRNVIPASFADAKPLVVLGGNSWIGVSRARVREARDGFPVSATTGVSRAHAREANVEKKKELMAPAFRE